MESISDRLLHDFHLRPMTQAEARQNLYSKLRAAGSDCPEFVFPEAVCTELWNASGGWPGILDRLALLALARAETLPVAVRDVEHPELPNGTWDDLEPALVEMENVGPAEPPQLTLTNNGDVINELKVEKPRMLIGRSGHNDIPIDSRFVSRHHALIVRHGSTTFLMDLNSTNGTFVNARRVSNHVLLHEDVVSIGHHKIKFNDPHAQTGGALDGSGFDDTVIMKTLDDMRNLLAEENTSVMPIMPEDLSTHHS
jgi:pSer/pThr/pTyr-binding forkhead associated (FHA) protein